ncbi:MAG TPA: SRPBCC family protein [Nocardioidaceae bacterium]|nr:SRPBCC family protein [Nocardioidaceae bacterium]
MLRVTVERFIAAPPEDVFRWLNDSSNYTRSTLTLREKRTKDGAEAPYGTGAVREVTGVGAWFREVITAYDEGRSFEYRIVKSIPGIDHEGGRILVEPTSGGSHVTWTSAGSHPRAWGGSALGKVTEPLLRLAFRQILDACEQDLTGP